MANSERRGEIGSKKQIYLLRIDKEESWNKIAGEVHSKHSNSEYLKFVLKRQLFDVTEKAEWPNQSEKLFHVITMSYFLSELNNVEQVKVVAEYINLYSSDQCSFLIVNDRNDDKVNYFKKILFQNLHCNTNYESEDSTKYHCGFSYNDNDRDLIGPKLTTNSIRFIKALYI